MPDILKTMRPVWWNINTHNDASILEFLLNNHITQYNSTPPPEKSSAKIQILFCNRYSISNNDFPIPVSNSP